MKIMFAGPSGIGKSTLAHYISQEFNIEFVSGSISDLIPKTKDISHEDMLNRDSKELYMEDYQILNLRKKLYEEKDTMVSDRSFLDSAAYFYYKQSDKIPACELEQFLEICRMCINKYCTHLIFLPLKPYQIREWIIEDNEKRITSGYFQSLISSIMDDILQIWGAKYGKVWTQLGSMFNTKDLMYGAKELEISSPYGSTRVLKLYELNQSNREQLIDKFLCE